MFSVEGIKKSVKSKKKKKKSTKILPYVSSLQSDGFGRAYIFTSETHV